MHAYFRQLQRTLVQIDDDQLASLLALCKRTIERGGTLWMAGNGGSAAIAQHWACDLSKAACARAQALGSNPAVLTAFANDIDYATALFGELSRLVRGGDALVCLSCSGTSDNIATLLRNAHTLEIERALITGQAAPGPTPISVTVNVPHDDYGVIEDCFAAIGHLLTYELRQSK